MINPSIVIKLGTSTLTEGSTHLSMPRMVELVRQMAHLHNRGYSIVVVSSGAIAAGREALNYPDLPKEIPAKQMLAAVGQPRLLGIYERLFSLYGITAAQVLLTRADLADRRRYLNSRNTLEALLSQRVIPVVNENDTVATEEIRVGDNDNLSALVANLIDADLLVLLTDQPGLYTADPRRDPEAKLIEEVTAAEIPDELWAAAGGSRNGLGTGGMVTKLQAADLARRSGVKVVIAPGGEEDILLQLTAGVRVGTVFYPVATAVESRKRYIVAGLAAGSVRIDEGACAALHQGSSLLPVGIKQVEGDFGRGDTLRVLDASGREIARGLTNYNSEDLKKIYGHHSDEIEAILGYMYGEEVIHRRNMVML